MKSFWWNIFFILEISELLRSIYIKISDCWDPWWPGSRTGSSWRERMQKRLELRGLWPGEGLGLWVEDSSVSRDRQHWGIVISVLPLKILSIYKCPEGPGFSLCRNQGPVTESRIVWVVFDHGPCFFTLIFVLRNIPAALTGSQISPPQLVTMGPCRWSAVTDLSVLMLSWRLKVHFMVVSRVIKETCLKISTCESWLMSSSHLSCGGRRIDSALLSQKACADKASPSLSLLICLRFPHSLSRCALATEAITYVCDMMPVFYEYFTI